MQSVFAWSLILVAGVVLLSIIPLTLGRMNAGYGFKSMSAPRALFDQLPNFGKRAVWCHQNMWEGLTLHAPACLLCLIAGVDTTIAFIAAWAHPITRLIYIGAYIYNIPLLRGFCWAIGLICTGSLYYAGLIRVLDG